MTTSINKKQEYVERFKESHPNYFKEYREKNHEKLSLYYVNNKDKFFRNIDCEHCGKQMLKANIKRHQKTKLCAKLSLKLAEEQNQQTKNAHESQEEQEQEEQEQTSSPLSPPLPK